MVWRALRLGGTDMKAYWAAFDTSLAPAILAARRRRLVGLLRRGSVELVSVRIGQNQGAADLGVCGLPSDGLWPGRAKALNEGIRQARTAAIQNALDQAGGAVSEAAVLLGMNRGRPLRLMKESAMGSLRRPDKGHFSAHDVFRVRWQEGNSGEYPDGD